MTISERAVNNISIPDAHCARYILYIQLARRYVSEYGTSIHGGLYHVWQCGA